MARSQTRTGAQGSVATRRSTRNSTAHASEAVAIKEENASHTPKRPTKRGPDPATSGGTRSKRVKAEDRSPLKPIKKEGSIAAGSPVKSETASPSGKKVVKTQADKAAELQAKKLKSYLAMANTSPFPGFARPTAAECKLARRILASLHGERKRPEKVVAPEGAAGCGNSASVLDALVRTILSQNTSDKNSTRAKLNMDRVYGGSDRWDAIAAGGQPKLQKAIESGGLSATKSRVIISILEQVKAKYGAYSLDHLFAASDADAMAEMLAFQGVGPKTASCVLLFCLQRESFAVDTHVHRITGLLGWRPPGASRDETHAHLDARVPDEDKYALHVLIINHGKRCDECKAGGKNLGRCELRKAFRAGKLEGLVGEELKEEEAHKVKEEDADETE